MTSQVFNQDGNMAFKPLGMETVMESDERKLSPMLDLAAKKTMSTVRLLSDAVIYEKKKGLMNYQTTE